MRVFDYVQNYKFYLQTLNNFNIRIFDKSGVANDVYEKEEDIPMIRELLKLLVSLF